MQVFDVRRIATDLGPARPWSEFLRTPSLSMGLYRLAAGQPDRQAPHAEDEAYYVLSGRAQFHAGDQELPVAPGTVLYVPRGEHHRFVDVTEDLTVLVFFSPPEGSLAASPPAAER